MASSNPMQLPAYLAWVNRRMLGLGAAGLILVGFGVSRYIKIQKPAAPPKPTKQQVDAFLLGVKTGQVPPVRDALKTFPSLATQKDPRSQLTPLHQAGSPEAAGLLLEGGAQIDAPGPKNKTPLHSAVEDRREAVVKFLVSRRASLSAKMDSPPYTAMQLAIAQGDSKMTEALLDAGAPLETRIEPGGETLLHFAARGAQVGAADALLRRGLEANSRDAAGRTPLFVTASTDTVILLLGRGADPGLRAADGETLLAALIKSTATAAAAHILRSSQALDPEHVGRALIAAAIARSEPLLQLALARRPEFRYMQEALYHAAAIGESRICEVLATLGAGAAQDAFGRTALHLASRNAVVSVLLRQGLFVDARDKSGRTPLFMAAAYGRLDVATALLNEGADAGAVTPAGDSPLLVACARDDAPMAKALVGKGAEVNTRNRWGATPLHYAAKAGNLEIAELLLHKGADPIAKIHRPIVRAGASDFKDVFDGTDVSGQTPVDLAASPVLRAVLLKYKEK